MYLDLLAVSAGGQGTAVSVGAGVVEEVVLGLRDGTTAQVVKPIAIRTVIAVVPEFVPKKINPAAGVGVGLYNTVQNYRKLKDLKGEWEQGVREAQAAHSKFDKDIAKLKAALANTNRYRKETDVVYQKVLDGIKEYCRRKWHKYDETVAREEQELDEDLAEMDDMVAEKRADDRERVANVDAALDAITPERRQAAQSSGDGDAAAAFFGSLIEGLAAGLSGGGYSGGGSAHGSGHGSGGGGGNCAALQAQIQSNRNYLNANRHASASVRRGIQQAANANIAAYNRSCR